MVVSDEMNSRFLVYLHSHLYSGRVNFRSIKQTTGIQNLDSQAYLDEPITYPPLEEQQTIARFLDFKTAQIDALIAKKKALLDKLAEKRTALISYAVTKGLDPSVPMKDSGVEWLGEIPAHWESKKLKFSVSYIGSGKTPKGGSEVYVQEGIMILRSQNVHDDGLRLDDVAFITDEADAAQPTSRVLAGDVLLNITGASIGRTSIVPTPFPQANVNQHVCILRPIRDQLIPEFLHLLLCSRQAKDQVSSLGNGTSREGLNFTQVGGLVFAFPPAAEQVEVVSNLEVKVRALNNQSMKVKSVIERLVEYRSALITNAVTGKIDVRGFEIPEALAGNAV
jgi:type I restriction enzyme S subunit